MTKINYLHTTGNRDIAIHEGELPEMQPYQIKIKTVLCGICRSDIGAYMGAEHPMPEMQQGHEGLGIVVEVGKAVKKPVRVGDIVSTWSDPAYATFYYANEEQFTVVPEISPKYILQPAACAINIGNKTLRQLQFIFNKKPNMYYTQPNILILGSGFMSFVLAQYFRNLNINFDIVGRSHPVIWKRLKIEIHPNIPEGSDLYDAVIDLTSKGTNYDKIVRLTKPEGLVCYASTPFDPVTTNFFDACWKCLTFIMPSPRNSDFDEMMDLTSSLIEQEKINMDGLWSCGYDRHDYDDVKRGFEDGMNRTHDYIRGYFRFGEE